MERVDIETTSKKLYDGDFVIMMSDGIIEAIQEENKEKMTPFSLSPETVLKKLDTSADGLSKKEAENRYQKYGPNQLATAKKESLLHKFFAQFEDFMILVLLCAAGISFLLSLLEGHADYADPIIILLVVTLNALLGVIQKPRQSTP